MFINASKDPRSYISEDLMAVASTLQNLYAADNKGKTDHDCGCASGKCNAHGKCDCDCPVCLKAKAKAGAVITGQANIEKVLADCDNVGFGVYIDPAEEGLAWLLETGDDGQAYIVRYQDELGRVIRKYSSESAA